METAPGTWPSANSSAGRASMKTVSNDWNFWSATESGITLINEVIEEHVKVQQELVSSLSETDESSLNQVLRIWLGQFEA